MAGLIWLWQTAAPRARAIIGTPGMLWRLKRKQDDERTMRICALAVGSGIVR